MKLFYYKDKIGYFGDDLNPWMWPQIFGRPIESVLDDTYVMIGLGTILGDNNLIKLRSVPTGKWVVMGAGAGYDHVINSAPMSRRCPKIFVRGPLTASVLGLAHEKALTDPAVLINRLSSVISSDGARHKVSVLLHHPHHNVVGPVWVNLCNQIGWNYINVTLAGGHCVHLLLVLAVIF